MCYHNSLSKSAQELKNRYNAYFDAEHFYEPIYHAKSFNRPLWPILTTTEPEGLVPLSWGFVKGGYLSTEEIEKAMELRTWNAKSETVASSWTFKYALKENHRCLVPSTGFFEWRHEGKGKIPYFIQLREQEIFSMAGLYSYYTNEDTGDSFGTFTILTCAANEMMMHIHNNPKHSEGPRMPVILTKESEKDWLNPDTPETLVKELMKPLPHSLFKAWTVASPATEKDTNIPTVIDFVEYPGAKIFG